MTALLKKSWMLLTTLVQQLRNVKTLTVWQKLTVPSHTSVGKNKILRALKKRLKIRKLDEESKILGELIYFPSF